VGDGHYERLFNRFVPFATYMVRNKVLFLSEALAHPAILNHLEFIGQYIEKENIKHWEQQHPGIPMDPSKLRQIELPWAPGYFFDLSSLSDFARGYRPLQERTGNVVDHLAQWVRLVNPGTQAGFTIFTNALGLTQRVRWKPILDKNGFPTGEYERVVTGWTESWSQDQPDVGSVFWLAEAIENAGKLAEGGWSDGELSQLFGQVFMYNAITPYNRGGTLYGFYKSLKATDAKAAEQWLSTPDGKFMTSWLDGRNTMSQFKDPTIPLTHEDPYKFWHSKTPAWQNQVKQGYAAIDLIRTQYAAKILAQPQNKKALKAEMYAKINQVYLSNTSLLESEVYSKTPAEWSKQLQQWQTDKLTADFLSMKPPAEGASDAEWDEFQHQKQLFLATYPQVKVQLGTERDAVGELRDKVEKEWDTIFDRIEGRNESIKALKAIIAEKGYDSTAGSRAQQQLDLEYIASDLDYQLLERDWATTFYEKDEYEKHEKGDTVTPKKGLLASVESLLDFDGKRLAKAEKEGKTTEFLREQANIQKIRAAVLYAKGGSAFGKFDPVKFSQYVHGNKDVERAYFGQHPEKQGAYEAQKRYIRYISVWGKLVGAEKWDAASAAWDKLPLDVRQRYLDTHPDTKMTLSGDFKKGFGKGKGIEFDGQFFKSTASRDRYIAGKKYFDAISVWGKAAAAGNWTVADKVWADLPQWVKDRYNAKHKGNKAKSVQTTQYLGYMAKWVKLFDTDDKVAMDFLDYLP
jgi:hypothetical protein